MLLLGLLRGLQTGSDGSQDIFLKYLESPGSSGSYTTYLNRSHNDTNGVEGFRSVSSLIAIEILA